jgi:periplasmic divalent cation tolerance protein
MASNLILLLSTFGSLVQGLESIYRWKGNIESTDEVLVIFKTTDGRVSGAMERLRALHPYEVPEIIQIPVTDGWPDYLSWVGESVSVK